MTLNSRSRDAASDAPAAAAAAASSRSSPPTITRSGRAGIENYFCKFYSQTLKSWTGVLFIRILSLCSEEKENRERL